MSVERSIYAYCSSGWGYYAYTVNMKKLIDSDDIVKKFSYQYNSPRNSSVWITKNRDFLQEEKNIEQHHPESFMYKKYSDKCIFRNGKNQGRDITPYLRPGNILVAACVTDNEDVKEYPAFYYGSKIFTELNGEKLRRSFFEKNTGSEKIIESADSLDSGNAVNVNSVIEFLHKQNNAYEILGKLLYALMNKNADKHIIICDKKENIIFWIAAVSIIFPLEQAKNISFNTYSYLNETYEFTDICGVYSPGINNDNFNGEENTTSYNADKLKENEKFILFDFEKNIIPDEQIDENFLSFISDALDNFGAYSNYIVCFHDFMKMHTSFNQIHYDYIGAYYLWKYLECGNDKKFFCKAVDFAVSYADDTILRQLYMCCKDDSLNFEEMQKIIMLVSICTERNILKKEDIIIFYNRLSEQTFSAENDCELNLKLELITINVFENTIRNGNDTKSSDLICRCMKKLNCSENYDFNSVFDKMFGYDTDTVKFLMLVEKLFAFTDKCKDIQEKIISYAVFSRENNLKELISASMGRKIQFSVITQIEQLLLTSEIDIKTKTETYFMLCDKSDDMLIKQIYNNLLDYYASYDKTMSAVIIISAYKNLSCFDAYNTYVIINEKGYNSLAIQNMFNDRKCIKLMQEFGLTAKKEDIKALRKQFLEFCNSKGRFKEIIEGIKEKFRRGQK